MRPLLVLALLLLPAAAADEADLERLAMARLAFEARLKLADLSGKDVRAEYLRAAAIFEAALQSATPEAPVAFAGRGRNMDNAVERGLRWLAAHQDDDTGGWDADGFMERDPADDRCDGKGEAHADVAVTGLAVFAFLGAGYNDRGSMAENRYGRQVRQALRFLMQAQNEDGSFVPAETPQALRSNAIATLAMCEAFTMTRNPRYKRPAQIAVAFLLKQQTAGAAWSIPDPKARDASITAWCVSALASARGGGIDVPEAAFRDALTWVDSVTNKETGRVGEAGATEHATAAALFTRALCGQGPRAVEAFANGEAICVTKPPVWNADGGAIDMDYWHWGTLALFRAGGDPWGLWSRAMRTAIVERQQDKGSRAGSWDPVGVAGGRVEATARMTLALEVYYRYARATEER
jgi:hypothetical protein